MATRRLGTALVIALALGAIAAARQAVLIQGTFTCGQDQSLPSPIQASWPAIVLAGDGRLYSPCPDGDHGRDHREIREATVIGENRYAADGDLRWRAAQAMARNATRRLVFPVVGSDLSGRASLEVALVQVDGLGGFIEGATVQPACARQVQIISSVNNVLRWQPGRLFMMVGELTAFTIRTERLVAMPPDNLFTSRQQLVKEGLYGIGTLVMRPDIDGTVISAAAQELRACYLVAGSGDVAALILEDLGLALYANESEVQDAEDFLVHESRASAAKTLGAVKGLEALIRQHPHHQIGDNARIRLHELVLFGDRTTRPPEFDVSARIRRLALMTLFAAHDLDFPTLRAAATDADWQMRRLVAGRLDLSDPEMAGLADSLAIDPAFQVRYELLSPVSRRAGQTHDCGPIVERFADVSPIVVMRAMDAFSASCSNIDEPIKTLASLADRLANVTDDRDWNVNARALTALARVKPAEARPRIEPAAKSGVWQVRVTAATISGLLRDETIAQKLARDPNANVRTAALDALLRMRSAYVVPEAILALQSATDYGLIRMAATVLAGLPEDSKDSASSVLLSALRRLTYQGADTSRDARFAIVERLGETLTAARCGELQPFMADFDDDVNAAVIKLYTKLVNAPPSLARPNRRYPFQPPMAAFAALPNQAVIQLDGGLVVLKLLNDVAPVTVARFAELVAQRHYSGRTFHRVAPNFIVQGGSPGDNDFMGTSRFLRDEVGPQAAHLRGAVAMSSRGRDMGDGQIFIDLVDLPRFDREYTVFAYVTQGMELVDKILEGARILNISVR